MITLKDYIKNRASLSLDANYVEDLSEDLDISQRKIWDLLEGIEEEVAQRIDNSIYCQQTISKWIFEEIDDILKIKISEKEAI